MVSLAGAGVVPFDSSPSSALLDGRDIVLCMTIASELRSLEGDMSLLTTTLPYTKTTLSNGLRIIVSEMPHTRSVSLTFFCGAGSRYETAPELSGISHFIEHMLFKGSAKRPTPREISEAIEGVGGVLNAVTDKELTIFWAKVGHQHFDLALDVLSDMLLQPLFLPAEVEKERSVILEELSMYMDSPQDWVHVLMDAAIFPDHPLGRDIAGTRESVSGMTREMLLEYWHAHYTPQNMVVSIAGDIQTPVVLDKVARMMGLLPAGQVQRPLPAQPAPGRRIRTQARDTEQTYLCIGGRALAQNDPRRYALGLLNVILGEGMSSRLFQEIREKRGLAYDVNSYVHFLRDTGAAVVSAGVHPRKTEPAIQAILAEVEKLRRTPVAVEELRRAKEFSKGRLQLRMEDSRSVAGWYGGQELLTGQIETVDDVTAAIDAVTAEEIQAVANAVFTEDWLNAALIGPLADDVDRLEQIVRFPGD
jgi:predicted Zn-dependent peptidase